MSAKRITGKTESDAVMNAAMELGIPSTDLKYTVIDSGSNGFLGLFKKPVIIEIKEEEKETEVMKSQTIEKEQPKKKAEKKPSKKVDEKSNRQPKKSPKVKDEVPVKEPRKNKTPENIDQIVKDTEKYLDEVLRAMGLDPKLNLYYNRRDNVLNINVSVGSDNMRIAICDDEVSMVQILEEKIKKLLPDAVIDKYLSGDELIASGSKPDILFLDIQMPGMDGMETAKVLRQDNEDMILIFVTAAEEYVFQAFDVGAFHYLVKPFSDEKLKEVVTKAVHNIKRSSRLEKDERYIMVQTAGSHIKIFLRDIVYAEVYNRKVIIHTRSTDTEYYGKLQELSDMAGTDFFRTHRAYLVHFKYVEKYDATCVTMKNGTALIAKQNYPEFVKQYLKYNQRKGNEVR